MDAIYKRFWVLCTLCLFASSAQAATFRTANFVVTASTDEIARRVANCAEYWRHELAIQWLGQPLPKNWYQPCPISVQVGQMGAGGQTTFTFENGEVYGWKMQVQGTLERVLDSVIPHEVNHTIFATHFRRPLPRWADEGAATLFEHESEQARQMQLLNRVITTSRRIPLNDLLTIREYPSDMQDVLTLYAEGYSLAGYLVGSKGEQGRQVYIQFLEDAHKMGWEKAIQRHYGYPSIALLEQQWTGWIIAGSPPLSTPGTAIAQNEPTANAVTTASPAASRVVSATNEDVVIRSQSPDAESPDAKSPATESQSAEEPVSNPLPALTGIDRAPAVLRAIPRQLRAARPQEVEEVTISSAAGQRTTGQRTVAGQSKQPQKWPRPEDFHPRALRQAGAEYAVPVSNLSPTAGDITTDPDAKYYSFPEARRTR